MHRSNDQTHISRRDLLTRLVAFGLSLRGVDALAQGARAVSSRVRWDDRFEAVISFEINQAISRVHRPYLAVYIENAQGNPVRTVALWVNTRGGERWIADLTRWFRNERERKRAQGGDLTQTVSSATRLAGMYNVVWNGRDDRGQPVEQGQYFVCIECNRQNGTYQILRQPLTFAAAPFYETIKGNYEIIGVSVEMRARRQAG